MRIVPDIITIQQGPISHAQGGIGIVRVRTTGYEPCVRKVEELNTRLRD